MSGTITVAEVAAGGRNNNIQIIFKNCAPFTDSISEIKNTQIDNAKEIDVVMAVCNLIEIVIIIQKHQEVFNNTIKMSQL